MTVKEKRKHIDRIELQAISRQAQERALGEYQARVDAVIEKIERHLMEGKFKTSSKGFLCVTLWYLREGMDFDFQVIRELEKRGYTDADFDPMLFGFRMFKVKL